MNIKKAKGETLIELIISITIISILIIPSILLLNSIINYNTIARSKTSNAAIAQNVIEYYRSADFANTNPDLKKNSPQYKYIAYNEDPKNGNLLNNTLDYKLNSNGSMNEKYETVIKSRISPGNSYNHVIKIVFSDVNDMVKIDTVVWDVKNKDKGQVEYAILKGY